MGQLVTRPDYGFVCNREGEALASACMLRVLDRVRRLRLRPAAGPPDSRRAVPSYDAFTGRLVQLSADQDGDRRVDQWTYLDGNRPLRGEADTDGDGRIDRWGYFDANAQLQRVGTSSRNDGVEDTLDLRAGASTAKAASIARAIAIDWSIATNFSRAT